jgi:hypothetical protein
MEFEEKLWSLFNELADRQIDGLKIEDAEFVVALIPTSERYSWLVWNDGLGDWINLIECQELSKIPTMQSQIESKEIAAIKESISTKIEPLIERIDQRLSRRFAKVLPVEVIGQSGSFFTQTEDISVGGIKVRDPIPDYIGKNFVIILSNRSGEQIKLFCVAIRTPNAKPDGAHRMRILGGEKVGLLRSWLLE